MGSALIVHMQQNVNLTDCQFNTMLIKGQKKRYKIPLPLREKEFWFIQFLVITIATVHYLADITDIFSNLPIPNSETVGFLLIPVAYAGIKYGLKGSVGTAIWAVVIWLPDLLLPDDRGEPWADLVELVLVIAVAVFVGIRINKEREAKINALIAQNIQKNIENRYKILFELNPSPTMILDENDKIAFANPAAFSLFQQDIIGIQVGSLVTLDLETENDTYTSKITHDIFDRKYRIVQTPLSDVDEQSKSFSDFSLNKSPTLSRAVKQIVMYDVTAESRLAQLSHDYAVSLIRVQEDERKRIALEIHDDTIQKLINISQKMQLTMFALGNKVKPYLEDIYDSTVDTIESLRRIATGLRPTILDDFGFLAALKIWVSDLVDADKIKIEICGEPTRLPSDIELNIFRVLQEALSNSLKHANATYICVSIRFLPSSINIEIKDNGYGFDISDISHGLGILSMKERMKMLKGSIKILSSPFNGTAIQISVDSWPDQFQENLISQTIDL